MPSEGGEWRQVVDAGIHYADVRCDRFMNALFWFNRARETTSREISYMGAAASAALAIVEASKNAIGLTPLGFELLDQTVNNIGAGLLYNLNPSTVRTIVEKQQKAYIASMTPSYTSRAIAFQVIQNYASICLPSSIETQVEEAIARQEYAADRILPVEAPNLSDATPDPFQFSDKGDVATSTMVESDPITLSGTGRPARISISSGGQYSINGGAWTSETGWVPRGASIRVRVPSASTEQTAASTTLTIGGVPGKFTVTTKAAPAGAPAAPPPPDAESEDQQPPPVDAPPVEIDNTQNGLPSPQAV